MPVFSTPPQSICILRLSAIGDICHTLPVIRSIQSQWPNTKITWIIGKTEFELLKGITDIDFVIFDKKNGFKEYAKIYSSLKHLHFDVLLHMQMSLRASMISLLVKSKIKVGFDRQRAKDAQWLFTNHKIHPKTQQHVMDSLFGFTEFLGITNRNLSWNIPIDDTVRQSVKHLLNNKTNYILISPCSSKTYRNWHVQGYATLADYIHNTYGYEVVLTGGTSEVEHDYGHKIKTLCQTQPLNLIGKTSLKEMLAITEGAICMISPDSGPAHMATAMNTPVIGLYATTNPDRARPYLSKEWVVNRYPDAIKKKFNSTVAQVNWGARVRDNWAMDLITVKDVRDKIDTFFKQHLDK